MNAVVALCHFCDLHGPSVLFCTRALHSTDLQGCGNEDFPYHSMDPYMSPRQLDRSFPATSADTMSPSSPQTNPRVSDSCEACRALPVGESGFISHDHEAKVSYVSSQHPDHPVIFSMVRQACVRSLSCEVCPGREGPIFFGDDTNGHVFSHTFFIRDVQARGEQSWYSVVVVMKDKTFLLNSWPFLVRNLRSILDQLQAKAASTFEEEKVVRKRAPRLMLASGPQNFRQRGAMPKPARPFSDLVGDKHIFRKLHRVFIWLLKVGGSRLTERLLEGPPTEDSIIDLEKQEETEEGFVKLFSKKTSEAETPNEDLEKTLEEIDPSIPVFKNLRHLIQILGFASFHQLAYHTIVGNQIIIRGMHKQLTKSIIECLKSLLPHGCFQPIYSSNQYQDSWRCNFLGLEPGITVPAHIEHYLVLDIIEPEAANADDTPGFPTEFEGYQFIMESPVELDQTAPAILTKMELALRNDALAESVVEQALICLKEEWMNKVKVLFKFTKAGGNRTEEDTRKLLQVVGVHSTDLPAVRFFMTGLSKQYKTHMLSSAISQTTQPL